MSQLCFPTPASDGIRFRSLGAAPAVLSTDVARHFQKRHSHVLREIDRLRSILPKSFHEPNFGLMFNDVKIGNGGSRKEKAYLLTRDALSLSVNRRANFSCIQRDNSLWFCHGASKLPTSGRRSFAIPRVAALFHFPRHPAGDASRASAGSGLIQYRATGNTPAVS